MRWLKDKRPARPDTERPPLGFVVSVGEPRSALARFPELRPARPPGLYRTRRKSELQAVLVDVKNLQPGPGTSFLRLLDHRPGVQPSNLAGLRADPKVSKTMVEKIRSAIV